MESICVLMTSYNPTEYIIAQVESILNQENVFVDLVIRDDASTNKKWINEIKSKYKVTVIEATENVGVAQNIRELIRFANIYKKNFKYFAYSDQDDIWKSDKLKIGIERLKQLDFSKPSLYYSNLMVVDEKLENGALLFQKGVVKNTLPQGVAQIFAFACTFVFNDVMLNAILEKPFEFMGFDHIVYYIALINKNIFYDNNSYILYRQHGNNVSGDKKAGIIYYIYKIKSIFEKKNDSARAGGGYFNEIANYLLKYYGDCLTKNDIDDLTMVAEYNRSLRNKLKLIGSKRVQAGYYPKDLFRHLRILLGKY